MYRLIDVCIIMISNLKVSTTYMLSVLGTYWHVFCFVRGYLLCCQDLVGCCSNRLEMPFCLPAMCIVCTAWFESNVQKGCSHIQVHTFKHKCRHIYTNTHKRAHMQTEWIEKYSSCNKTIGLVVLTTYYLFYIDMTPELFLFHASVK